MKTIRLPNARSFRQKSTSLKLIGKLTSSRASHLFVVCPAGEHARRRHSAAFVGHLYISAYPISSFMRSLNAWATARLRAKNNAAVLNNATRPEQECADRSDIGFGEPARHSSSHSSSVASIHC